MRSQGRHRSPPLRRGLDDDHQAADHDDQHDHRRRTTTSTPSTSTTSTTTSTTTTTTSTTSTTSTTATPTSTTTEAPGCVQTVCADGSCRGGDGDSCTRPRDCCSGVCELEGDTCLGTLPACDCSNLNNCSGHGVCTEVCICDCDDPYSGAFCADLPPVVCNDFTTCTDCQTQSAQGCVWCSLTVDGREDDCIVITECLIPVEICTPVP